MVPETHSEDRLAGLPHYCPHQATLDNLDVFRMEAVPTAHELDAGNRFLPLRVPASIAAQAQAAGGLKLTDPEGTAKAILSVDGTCDNAPSSGGNSDENNTHDPMVGITGSIHFVGEVTPRPFGHLYSTPDQIAHQYGTDALPVLVSSPLSQNAIQQIDAHASGRPVVLIVLTGHGTPQAISGPALLRASLCAAELMPHAAVVAVPAASSGDAVADQDFHRHIASAYASNEPFCPDGPFCPEEDRPIGAHRQYPEEIAEIIRTDQPSGTAQGVVVFLTGLSGSGKSTIAQELRNRIIEAGTRTVSLLDGDRVRRHLSRGLGFSKEDREINIERIGWVAAEIAYHGGVAICSPIAPFDATRKTARAMAEDNAAAFLLVHIATPLAECERRDRKGLYAQARNGDIGEFTGISSPYEEPDDADIAIDTTGVSVERAVEQILRLLRSGGWIENVADGLDA